MAAVFAGAKYHGIFIVRDISAGGACLVGSVPVEPGRPVTVHLQLLGRKSFKVRATVLRQDARGVAIAFVGLSARGEDAIQQAIVYALEQEQERRSATILVLDGDAGTRAAIERDLRSIGRNAVAVGTPLDAIAWLDRLDTKVTTVIVDPTPGPSQGAEFLAFIGEHRPHIRRVVMSSESQAVRFDVALAPGRANATLPKPWNGAVLAETVGESAAVLDIRSIELLRGARPRAANR